MSKINIGIGIGVIVMHPTEKKMLVTRRRKGLGKGCVAFAGGKIEQGETIYNCSVREVFEETGLVVRPRMLSGENNDPYSYVLHTEEWFRDKKHQITLYVVADTIGGVLANPEPDKHEDWQWKTLDELAVECKPTDWIPLSALFANMEKIGF